MKVVSWNVNGNAAVEDQAAALLEVTPDLVALQEVRRGTVEPWKQKLADAGFAADDILTTQHLVGDRTNFLLVASRHPIAAPASRRRSPSLDFEVPFPELVLAVLVAADGHELEFVNTHVPNGSSNGFRKVEHFEGLYRYLARNWSPHGRPRLLCGDFNSPKEEHPNGTVITWGQRSSGELVTDRGQRWDAAERSVILGLKSFDLVDLYRRVHGYGQEPDPVSWAPARRAGSELSPEKHDRRFGRRFDHIFAPSAFEVTGCGYYADWRLGRPRLSDHAAVWADFRWP